jgi:hypothetical protein
MPLKVFTAAWREMDASAQRVAVAEYLRELEVLTDACSPALFEFARNHTLHDGLLVQLRLSMIDRSAVLQIQGWNPKFDERRLYTFLYRDVEAFEELGPPDSYHSRHETTDISYSEFHPSGNGAFEHRILFHSDVEYRLVFKGFEFSYEVTPLRRAG